jgi:hypothetical protein
VAVAQADIAARPITSEAESHGGRPLDPWGNPSASQNAPVETVEISVTETSDHDSATVDAAARVAIDDTVSTETTTMPGDTTAS